MFIISIIIMENITESEYINEVSTLEKNSSKKRS